MYAIADRTRLPSWLAMSLLALTLLAVGCIGPRASLGPVVEPEELARLLKSKSADRLIVLDVREAAAYASGHVAAAARVDGDIWKQESLATETGLDHMALWRDRIGAMGISGRNPVVIYDDGRMTEAARVWFIFQHVGVPQAGVLNGGYPALAPLIAEGRIPANGEPTVPRPVVFDPPAGASTRIGLVDRQQVRQAVERGEAQILDARTRAEYTGLDLRRNLRGGHIPSAINIPHSQLLDERGRLKPPQTLANLLEQAGLRRGEPVIAHCDGGGRASLAALAADYAGFGPVMNYYRSFGDWAADVTCPLDKIEP